MDNRIGYLGWLVACSIASAQCCEIIDFEEFDFPPNKPVAFGVGEPVLVSGFLFTPVDLWDSHYGNSISWWGYNGTHVTGYHQSVLMERADGEEFDLVAFDYAGPPGIEAPITVIASNDSSIDFIPDGQSDGIGGVEDFETFILPRGFADITSVTFIVGLDWHLDNVLWHPTPECPWDLDGTGGVGVSDLLSLLASWGPCKDCPADFDGDGTVGVPDLLALLANWGPCP